MKITPIAYTTFNHSVMEELTDWNTDAYGSSALSEAAGRACYQSWSKPNPATATNAGYLKHILDVGHDSVLRHGSVSVYVEGVSRSFSHELIRHHVGTAVSQLSQRYVDSDVMDYVIPPAFRGNEKLERTLQASWYEAVADYETAVHELQLQGKTRKQAREAARAFLPGCAETKLVFTGNHEAWRNIVQARGTVHADAEIREFAVAMLQNLKVWETNIYQDLQVETVDGVRVVSRSVW